MIEEWRIPTVTRRSGETRAGLRRRSYNATEYQDWYILKSVVGNRVASLPAGGENSTLATPNSAAEYRLTATARFHYPIKLMSGLSVQLVLLLALVSLSSSPSSVRCLGKERTLGMIKPDGVSGNYTEEIQRIVVDAGFDIVKERLTQFDKETASKFYDEHSSRSFFPHLVSYMTSGPVVVMVLEKRDAVADWRGLIGPTDAQQAKISHPHRALCGKDSQRNCVHGSDSISSAEREINFFFGDVVSDDPTSRHDEL
ncbi:nucleoside diphosphate kinase 5 [Hirschfeldia incana]|nr:nucleoside diphosphate kinase 5 [Hirschfeldia incana]